MTQANSASNPAAGLPKFKKLVTLLKELFQLDQPDLDFGIYRIMHAKAGEITQFLERDLLPQVSQAFAQYQSADSSEIKKKIDQLAAQVAEAGMDPEASPKVRELREQLKSAIDLGALENEVYDHLFSFFRRYYSEGDFLAKRVYRPGVYAIPYEGEEVTLHWANKDQYYIKTSEYLRDYAFRLRPEADETKGEDSRRVHFRLVDAAEGEHGNVKAADGKDRVFVLAREGFIAVEGGELDIRFEYRPATLEDWPEDQRADKKKPPAQKDLIALATRQILAAGGDFTGWLAELARPHTKADGEAADYSRLEAHLHRYAARNTFDYFIHKDLGGFLRRELDFYIKNEVMHLDDVESETAAKVEQYLSKIKVVRRIAGKVIDFLAQLENFQKKLWLKKKFVVESHWLVAISQIPDVLLPEICANAAQLEEWKALHSLHELPADITRPAYSEPLTAEYLRAHPSLMVDTRHFDEATAAKVLDSYSEVASTTAGLLVNGDNFHALSLMQKSYCGKIKCIYIDPPYNTANDEFAYKDSYRHSSWIAMMADRLSLSSNFISSDGVFFCSIDDNESSRLRELLDSLFGAERFQSAMTWIKRYAPPPDVEGIGYVHETIMAYAATGFRAGLLPMTAAQKDRYENLDGDPRGPWKPADYTCRYTADERPTLFYPVINPNTGEEIWPKRSRVWAMSQETHERNVSENRIWWGREGTNRTPALKNFLDKIKQGIAPSSVLSHEDVGHTDEASKELRDLFPDRKFTPKPVRLIKRLIKISDAVNEDIFFDFFAGSGTSAHAVVQCNRDDGGQRKMVLVEMGASFDEIVLPRVKKVTFSPEWNGGQPKRPATTLEAERGPRFIKVLRLESYEDTLNNLALRRSAQQQSALDFQAALGASSLREQYLLRYQLDVESRGSASLLNVRAFTDPTAYKLSVKTPGSDESREVNVDLLETFNWLLGLTVQHIAAPRSFSAEFERDTEGRLKLAGRLKQDADGPWWFRTVTGTTPEGRKTVVIWRKLTGNAEQDNLVLETWFRDKQAFSVKDSEFDLIYVNGDNTLENLRLPDESWKVRLIEEDFHRLMFEGTES
ncbi:adenine-specific DNA-methyltransferase [Hydrocarboniphaga daqingensis]|uniref:Adenine-specific DNA-methyltransferase n=1 Tax=Hydrocarboniphaga daqingensis TaxID=490188 RepID=A0A1M5P8F7_9GAMM|nr:site-specific DNA-methyltransferase [Hydrocarboniphaga daqingensis]SHG97985.1 adenine-specific DNA-methyltransferase [Hydrocarboniphaga daqingensis]